MIYMLIANESSAQLSKEQYDVLNVSYKDTSVKLFNYTIETKVWSKFLNSSDLDFYKSATCDFFDEEFILASQEVESKLWGLHSKHLEKKKLPAGIEIVDRYDLALVRTTEPIIVGKYAFVFQEAEDNQFLFILIKENGKWNRRCSLDLYQEPFVDPIIK
ncbi:hypothetical protein SAMN05444394_2756 [Algoriphagus halophilus]|uniref:Uncharacterized protein n=2 Tax=Algoriphagus halophilus TaxID=226505 RepID=A0A1N6FV92_9BACT|nr:hypothetical protein SAMN05444394_2756 [Algoriphagus halophilus]